VRKSGGFTPLIERHKLSDEDHTRSINNEDVIQYYEYYAGKGDTNAQVALGKLHLTGAHGVSKDYDTALRYFQQANEDSAAHSFLGLMYYHGFGVNQDYSKALEYYKLSAGKTNSQGQNGLGTMYLYGLGGLEKNSDKAKEMFEMSAKQGYNEAWLNLGLLYLEGKGNIKKEYVKARSYFEQAAIQGNTIAHFYMAKMYMEGLGVPYSCQMALQLFKTVAERGPWTKILTQAYERYQASEYDIALLLYEQVAEQGYEIAQSNSALMYDKSLGYQGNDRYERAFHQYIRSAQQSNVESSLKIGDYHYYGLGTPVNYEKAVAFYRSASDTAHAQASFNLGFMHEYGLGIPQDFHLAKRFYDMATDSNPEAQAPVYLALLSLAVHYIIANIPALDETLHWFTLYWDTILVIILCLLLPALLIIRQQRITAVRS